MQRIFSKVRNGQLLHFVLRSHGYGPREDIIESTEVLQLSRFAAAAGDSFRPHRHLAKRVALDEITAQEAWVVMRGRIRVTYYDLDDSVLERVELGEGDLSVSLSGGHGYEILEDSQILEFKTGPYLGQVQDKVFID